MSRFNVIMGAYMVVSCASVSAGGILLRYYSLVPVILTYATAAAVMVLAANAFFVFRGSRNALNFGVILSILAIASSISSPSHLAAMGEILQGGIIALLDVLEIIGFYVFPVSYMISWAWERMRRRGNQPRSLS